MYTKGSAAATNESTIKGTIETGKFADFILLDKDPTTIPPKQIHALQIINTWVGGKLVYDASKK
ncbi:amidohydrolase family protein, partial [Enterococcus faecium]|uniref:amidohydrolase family protein n=1 Tax=Enterococcus faecium TaxID=1352 RepID=UPI0034E96A01